MSNGTEILWLVILTVISYFIGNISPATVMGKIYGVDIRKAGSGNPGTTNVLRTLGKKAAACTLLVDVLKGFLPTFAAVFFVSDLAAILCATGALIGHMWPVCFRFQGGKGVATGFGAALAIDWRVGLLALLFAALGVLATRRMSCGSVTAAVSFPVLIYIFVSSADGSMGWEYIWAAVMALLIIWRHRTNLLRIIRGEEPTLSLFDRKKSR